MDTVATSRPARLLATCVVVALAGWLIGCESKQKAAPDTAPAPQFRSYTSESAPYQLKVPMEWTALEAGSMNRHADYAVQPDKRLYVMVIPQKLPQIGEMEPPGPSALREASISRMSDNIKEFRVERDGPVELGPAEGISVFAEGVSNGSHVQYIATYIAHQGWGYQVIAWGPAKHEDRLVSTMDTFFEGWQFTDNSLPSGRSDAGGAEATPSSSADVSSNSPKRNK